MKTSINPNSQYAQKAFHTLGVLLTAVCMLALVGCFSSTKVYQTDKTITYNGSLYNMANVQKIDTIIRGEMPNGDIKNMKGMDKKAVQALLKQGSPIMVTTAISMDSEDLIYERRNVDKYSTYSSMKKKFESAAKKVGKFMADKKATQLKLK